MTAGDVPRLLRVGERTAWTTPSGRARSWSTRDRPSARAAGDAVLGLARMVLDRMVVRDWPDELGAEAPGDAVAGVAGAAAALVATTGLMGQRR